MKTTIRKQKNGYWSAVLPSGVALVEDESYQVASNVADALNSPDDWEPTEAYEIAALARFDYDRMIDGDRKDL